MRLPAAPQVLALALLAAAAAAAPALAQLDSGSGSGSLQTGLDRSKRDDRCLDDSDCRKREGCVRGECVQLVDDGDKCSRGSDCRSGTCRRSWYPAGSFCVTPCDKDKDCPRKRPFCNTSPVFATGTHVDTERAALARRHGHGEQDEQDEDDSYRREDEQDEQDEQDVMGLQHHEKHGKDHHKDHHKGHEDKKDKKRRDDKKDSKKAKRDDDDRGGGGQQPEELGGRCVECMEDEDCSKGYFCQRAYLDRPHTCIELGDKCSSLNDCGSNEYCEQSSGRCRPFQVADVLQALLGANRDAAAVA